MSAPLQDRNADGSSNFEGDDVDNDSRADLSTIANDIAAGDDECSGNRISIIESPNQFYLLTHPRSASNLLVQILNLDEQSHLVTGKHQAGYYFIPLINAMDDEHIWGTHINTWTPEQRSKMGAVADECYAALSKDRARLDSEPGKSMMFVKEHSDFLWSPVAITERLYKSQDMKAEPWLLAEGPQSKGNGTFFSDEYLLKWMPTFLVRHPALAFPSHLRAAKDLGWGTREQAVDDEGLAMQCTLASSRTLFDFFKDNLPSSVKQYGGVDWPIVLTGDAVMKEPDVVKRYASIIGLDVEKLRFKWEAVPQEVLDKLEKGNARMINTLTASTGIVQSKAVEAIDIDAEVLKWKEEFGEYAAEKLEGWVRGAMPHYEYMKARRLRAEPTIVDMRRV